MEKYPRPTAIKGLSEIRRLPRLGKIRLGTEKAPNRPGRETDYFVVPPEVAKIPAYGDKPKVLDIMFPVDDESVIAPQAYEYYGSSKGLKCTGDGEYALELDETTGAMNRRDCPCEKLEKKQCSKRMHLRVILPKVNMGGVYQIDTSSFNSIVDVLSGIQWVKCATTSPEYPRGRLAWIPLVLERVPTETHYDGKKQIHYTLKIRLEADIKRLNQIRGGSPLLSAPICEAQEGEEEKEELQEAAERFGVDEPFNESPDLFPTESTDPEGLTKLMSEAEGIDYWKAKISEGLKQMGKKTQKRSEEFYKACVYHMFPDNHRLLKDWVEKDYKEADSLMNQMANGILKITIGVKSGQPKFVEARPGAVC